MKDLAPRIDHTDWTEAQWDAHLADADKLSAPGTCWSAGIESMQMGETVLVGTGLMLSYEMHWGAAQHMHLPDNPSWNDLNRIAAQAIVASGDTHHTFIEQFRLHDDGKTIELITGS